MLGLVGLWQFCMAGCGQAPQVPPPPAFDVQAMRPKVAGFCGACHTMPQPEFFTKWTWLHEVINGYRFHEMSGRKDLELPLIHEVAQFYRAQAPERLELPEVNTQPQPDSFSWRREDVVVEGLSDSHSPAVSFLRWGRLDEDEPELLLCEMASGIVMSVQRRETSWRVRRHGRVTNPAHVEPCDLDGDGRTDLVVASLGSFLPEDHDEGGVIWLRRRGEGFQPVVLVEGVGRVADVQPIDFDGDGDIDLVAAEFGFLRTGGILLLENTGSDGGMPQFVSRRIDPRHGTIHVPVSDLNNDDVPDFVALISQEYETVDVFLGRGDGTFDTERIYSVNNPAYGSSGIQLIDMDGDADLDVLYSNGDSLDNNQIRSFQGIQWLENRGGFPFVHHQLTNLPGAYRALGGDLDGDGDIDIAAVALLAGQTLAAWEGAEFDSVIWLEQKDPGRFVRHRIESGTPKRSCLELADLDQDGDIDICVSGYTLEPLDEPLARLTIYWNEPAAADQ